MLFSARCMWAFDKLAAVPILCVEQLVLPLFCINASQSAIISLWRSVPVWLCHDCLYQSGLLTICYAVVWQEQSSRILCILVLLLIWVLQIVIACAASGRTTWLSIDPFPEKRLVLVRWPLPSLWMLCLFSMECSEGKPFRTSPFENQTLDFCCLWHTI